MEMADLDTTASGSALAAYLAQMDDRRLRDSRIMGCRTPRFEWQPLVRRTRRPSRKRHPSAARR
jgi:hypothetical protein